MPKEGLRAPWHGHVSLPPERGEESGHVPLRIHKVTQTAPACGRTQARQSHLTVHVAPWVLGEFQRCAEQLRLHADELDQAPYRMSWLTRGPLVNVAP